MVYQAFKFLTVRLGATVMLLITAGYGVLFVFHEMFFHGMRADDSILKWSIVGTSLFVGFIAYSFMGDWRFSRALSRLQALDIDAGREGLQRQFENLVRFTRSSCFWPGTGARLRQRALKEYADFLLAKGVDDAEAQRVFLKAYLRDPEDTRLRDVMVSTLTRKIDLSPHEIDILLLVLKAQHYEDKPLLNFLAKHFLEQDEFSHKSEPVFHKVLQLKTGLEKQVSRLMLPVLLSKKRSDAYTIEFYLNALPDAEPEVKPQLAEIIGLCFAEIQFETGDPVLHDKCARVFEQLPAPVKRALLDEADEARLSAKWKKIKLFTAEDRKTLKALLVQTGIVRPWGRYAVDFFKWCLAKIRGGLKWIVMKLMDGLQVFGLQNTRNKFAVLGICIFLILATAGVIDWQLKKDGPVPGSNDEIAWEAEPQPAKPGPAADHRTHTIQVAAVTTQAKADHLVASIKRKGIEGAYILRVERKKGGFWYKIRVGTFDSKEKAQAVADQMVQLKLVRNYFLIALKQPANTSQTNTR